MESFYIVFGPVAAIVAGVIILALFFTGLSYARSGAEKHDIRPIKGLIKDGRLVNVLLSSGRKLESVKLIGFGVNRAAKDAIPYEFNRMVVFEKTTGGRIFVRADTVRLIEEVVEAPKIERDHS